jgi:hypothetical protein
MSVPAQPKIYHIVHVDRLPSILACGGLLSDAQVIANSMGGTTIGMGRIKQRRLQDLTLECHPGLHVGQCVPFYFCPRSVMLFLIHCKNYELTYQGGQEPVIHLQADLGATVQWAQQQGMRWAFTLSNAGSFYFEDRNNMAQLNELDWNAINAHKWKQHKDGKQAEFLLEQGFPWELIEKIGVYDQTHYHQVMTCLNNVAHKPPVQIETSWYY